jgi:hypothetical protein
MELTPRDLGTERYLSTIRKRVNPMTPQGTPANGMGQENTPVRRRGRRIRSKVRRYWVRDLNVDEETADEVAEIVSKGMPGVGMRVGVFIFSLYLWLGIFITTLAHAPGAIPFMMFLIWATIMPLILLSPRKNVKQMHEKPLTVAEVEAMLPHARGRLDRMYLNLVLDAIRQEVPTESAKADIRAALRHLGDVVASLPADPVGVRDAGSLHKEAMERRQQAVVETDSIVQASLMRQAEALERRATVAAINDRSSRRASALRREARTMMDSLRSILVAYQQTAPTDTTSIGQLSEAVQRMAGEAQAVAVAKRELEDDEIERLFGGPLPQVVPVPVQPVQQPTTPVAQPAPTNGHNHTVQSQPSTPTQQPQVVSRQWWRGGNVG